MSMQHKKEQYMVDTKANWLGLLTVSDKEKIETIINSKVRALSSAFTDSETRLVRKLLEYQSELKTQKHLVAQLQQNQALFLHFIRERDIQWYQDNVIKKQESGREEPPRQSQLDWLKNSGT